MFCLYIVHYFLSSMEDINAFKSVWCDCAIDQILRFQSAIHFACAHSLTTSTRFYNHNCKMQMTIFFRACIHDIYLLSACKVTQNIRNMQVKRAESLLL